MQKTKIYDNILFGNRLNIKIKELLQKQNIVIVDFFDFLIDFLNAPSHKRFKREFYKIYEDVVYPNEIPCTEKFIQDNLKEAKKIGFERMMSSKIFTCKGRLLKTVSEYYFLMYNYWYIIEILSKVDFNDKLFRELSEKISSIVKNNIYTLNFDCYLEKFLNIKHVHGTFVSKINNYDDIIALKSPSDKFYYKFLFGAQGYEKYSGLNCLKEAHVDNYDYEFMFSDKNFGDFLIYGVSFGTSNLLPNELKNKYSDFTLIQDVEGHILQR